MKSVKFRSVVEYSIMSNNDEWVLYSEEAIDRNEFDNPEAGHHLVFCRPVFSYELEAGLNPKISRFPLGSTKEPEVTLLLDAMARLKVQIKERGEVFKLPIERSIVHYIANAYYDCMSGGMPSYCVSIIREAIERLGVSLDLEVYPGDDGWHTVGDFMEDTKDAEKLSDLFKRFLPQVPEQFLLT